MSPHKIEQTALLFVHGRQGQTICGTAIAEVSARLIIFSDVLFHLQMAEQRGFCGVAKTVHICG